MKVQGCKIAYNKKRKLELLIFFTAETEQLNILLFCTVIQLFVDYNFSLDVKDA